MMQIAMKVDVVAVILIVFGAAFSFALEQSGRAGKKTILHAAKNAGCEKWGDSIESIHRN
jgi:hypothetical protein